MPSNLDPTTFRQGRRSRQSTTASQFDRSLALAVLCGSGSLDLGFSDVHDVDALRKAIGRTVVPFGTFWHTDLSAKHTMERQWLGHREDHEGSGEAED